jgi:hypothetical protein
MQERIMIALTRKATCSFSIHQSRKENHKTDDEGNLMIFHPALKKRQPQI